MYCGNWPVARPLGDDFRIARFLLFVCLPVLSVCRNSFRSLVVGRSIDQCPRLYYYNHHGSGVAVGGTTRLPIGCPSKKRSFFLAATAIELASLLGYGRSQYTGHCTNFINTTFGGAAGVTLAFIVPRGTVFPRTLSLPRGIVTVSIRSLGARGVSHRLVGVVPGASRLRSSTLTRRALAKSEHFVQVSVCLLAVPAAIGEPETASCQLATRRHAEDKAFLPPPTPQRTDHPLLPSLRINPPPVRCRWWRA